MQQSSPTKLTEFLSKEWEFLKFSASYLSIILTAVLMPFVTVL